MTLKLNLGKGKAQEAKNRGGRFDASAAHLRHLLSAGPVVVYSCALGDGFPATYISPNVESLMGWAPQDFVSGDGFWAEHVHPDDLPRVCAAQQTILDHGSQTTEYRFRHRDGAWRWTLDSQVLIRDETGAATEIAGAWTDITAQKTAEEALRRQSAFQRIVAEISADLIDAGEGGLDGAINAALMKVGGYFDADRCYMFRFSPDFETIHNTHEWCAEGIAPQIQDFQNYSIKETPWHFGRLRQGGVVNVPDVDTLPPEAAAEKREFKRLGLLSILSIAVRRQGDLIGFLGLDSVARKRDWNEGEAALLRVVADMIAGAIIRERAAKELIQSNRLLDSLVENMPAMVFLKRAADLRFERFNRAGEQLVGFPRADLLGRNDYDLFPKDQADHFVVADRAVLAGEAAHDIREEPIRTASGEVRQLRTSKIALRDAAGRPTHLLGISVDITEAKQVENALRESQARLLEAQRIARLGHWTIDLAAGTIEWSKIIYDIFGRDPAGYRPTLDGYYAEIVHPEDADALRAMQETVIATGGKGAIDHRFLRPDGSVGWVHLEGIAEYDAPGRPIRLLGVVQDITERKRVEIALKELNAELEQRVVERTAALAESEERLARGQRIARLGSWEYDLATSTWQGSDEFFRIFGFDPKKTPITAGFWLAAVHPDDRDWVKEALRIGRESHRPQEIQYRVVLPDGQIRIIRARGEEQDGKRVGSVMDVTERAQVERALAEARRIARLGGWEWNARTGERWWSAEMYEILGVDPAILEGDADAAVTALIHPADRARVVQTWRDAGPRGSYAQTFRIRRPDGAIIFCQERGEFLRDGRWSGSLMDITDLVRTQEQLAEAQRIAHLGNWRSDEVTGEQQWSDEMFRIFGLEPGSATPALAWLLPRIHADDRERVQHAWSLAAERDSRYEIEFRIIRPDGEVRTIVEIGEPARDAGFPGAAFVGTVLDITERKRIESSLAEAQRIARTGSWESLPDRRENWWSDELYNLLGLVRGRDASIDANWNALIHPDDREAAVKAYLSAYENRTSYETRYRLIRLTGELRFLVERGQWSDGRFIGTLSDTTEQEHVQRQLAEAQRIAKTGSWDFSPDTGAGNWSAETYRLLGYDPAAVMASPDAWRARVHPEDLERVAAASAALVERFIPYEIRYRLIRPNGEQSHVIERGEWVDGRCSGTTTDITELERIQRSLAEAQRIAKTGSWEFFPELGTSWWSEETYRLFGLTPDKEAPRLQDRRDLLHPEDRDRAIAVFEAARARKAGYEVRYRIKRPDGETCYLIERGEWLDDRYAGTVSDITESERAQRSMAAAQRIALTGSWEYLPEAAAHWWSAEMYRLLGLEPGTAASADDSWDALIHPQDRARAVAAYHGAHRTRSNYEVRYRLMRPDGELRFMVERGEWVEGRHIGTLTDITVEEHVKRQLAEAQRIARLGSWAWIPGSRRLRWSEEALRLFGYDDGVAERDHRDWQNRIHPDDRAGIEAELAEKRNRGLSFELNYRIVLPGGAVRSIHERIESEVNEAGELVREFGIFQDVTESRQVQLAMQALSGDLIALEGAAYFQAAAERLARLLDTECAIIVRRDAAQPGMLRTVAMVEDGVLLANFSYSPIDTPCAEVIAGQSVVVARGVKARYPRDVYFADHRTEAYAAEPISDHTGAVIGHVAIVSRRPLAETSAVQTVLRMFAVAAAAAMGREQIHQRDAWLRAILENTPSEIVLKDLDLRIMAASKAFAGERSLAIAEQIGKSTRDFLPPEIAEVYEDADRKVIATGEAIAQDVVEVEDGKTRHIQNIKFPLRDDHGRIIGICSISTDRTEVKRIEAQLAQAQKMEAIGALTGGMAHDFNNYLAVIIGNLEMLKEDLAHDPRSIRLVDAALRGATRSEELTRSLLAFARHQPLAQSIIDVGGRIRETAALLERTLGEEIKVVVDIAQHLSPVLVDGGQLASCLVNLANNARDAMPDGGEVRISARNVRVDALHGAMSEGVAPGDYVVIEVADTGSGMTAEVLANVFEPFFTTKGPGHGTGLGLSMAYGFVQQSGGQIRIYSEPGFGSNVRIYLPSAAGAAAADGEAEPAAEPMAGHGETILLVEDNDVVRRTTANQLSQLGYRVIEAETGDAAAAILERRKQTIDLLLTDVVMPGSLDGYALARLAREKRPEVKIVLTSGFVGGQLRKRNQDMPDWPMLAKPCRKAQLARAMRAALDDNQPAGAARAAAKPNRNDPARRRR